MLGCEGALADCASLEVLDLGSSPYESATFNQQCTERIFFGVPSTIRSSALDTNDILPLIPCIGSTESMNVMRLGSYRFPNYASSSSSSSSSISPSQSGPFPVHLPHHRATRQILHLTSRSCILARRFHLPAFPAHSHNPNPLHPLCIPSRVTSTQTMLPNAAMRLPTP